MSIERDVISRYTHTCRMLKPAQKRAHQRLSQISQSALVKRAKSGDHQAFESLIKPLSPKIFGRLLREIGDRSDAEDLFQDTLLKAFSKLHTFREEAQFSSWVYQICTHHILMYHRRKKTRRLCNLHHVASHTIKLNMYRDMIERERSEGKRLSIDKMDRLLFMANRSTTSDPETIAMRREALLVIEYYIDHLDPHYRSVLRSWVYDGLNLEQIRNREGLSLGTVKSRLYRARKKVRRRLNVHFDLDALSSLTELIH